MKDNSFETALNSFQMEGKPVLGLGEVMLRFLPLEKKLDEAELFRIYEAGGEYNVIRNLAKIFNVPAAFLTALSRNSLGKNIAKKMEAAGVLSELIIWKEPDPVNLYNRVPLYFGESIRESDTKELIFDRSASACSSLGPGDLDRKEFLNGLFKNHSLIHSGAIFSAISKSAFTLQRRIYQKAFSRNLLTSFDLNYRSSQWWETTEVKAKPPFLKRSLIRRRSFAAEMKKILPFCRIVFATDNSLAKYFSTELEEDNLQRERDRGQTKHEDACPPNILAMARKLLELFPNMEMLALSSRGIIHQGRQHLQSCLLTRDNIFSLQDYFIDGIRERIGSGDAFAAGFLYALQSRKTSQDILEWATASALLAMQSEGDHLNASRDEVEQFIKKNKKS